VKDFLLGEREKEEKRKLKIDMSKVWPMQPFFFG